MRHLPNILTLSNLFSGCCALVFLFSGEPVAMVAWFTLASFIFDYGDGMAARALGVSSPLGKELDSLADMVSFGVVPGAMLYRLLCATHTGLPPTEAIQQGVCYAALPAFILSAFSGLRLGRFNLDTRQTTYFIGLSTPANTVFILGLALSAEINSFGQAAWVLQPVLLYGLIVILSWLLNSEIPMFGLKIKKFDWKSNALNIGAVLLMAVLGWLLKEVALSGIILIYIAASLLFRGRVTA